MLSFELAGEGSSLSFIASGSSDYTVSLVLLPEYNLVRRLRGHRGAILTLTTVRLSATLTALASGSVDGDVVLWCLGSGAMLHTFRGDGHFIRALLVVYPPHSQHIAPLLICGVEGGTLRTWDMDSKALVWRSSCPDSQDSVRSLALLLEDPVKNDVTLRSVGGAIPTVNLLWGTWEGYLEMRPLRSTLSELLWRRRRGFVSFLSGCGLMCDAYLRVHPDLGEATRRVFGVCHLNVIICSFL